MTDGKGLVQRGTQCFLCGQKGGLKLKCSNEEGCVYCVDGKMPEAIFHVTCARQAGFEVNAEEIGNSLKFYGKPCSFFIGYRFGVESWPASHSCGFYFFSEMLQTRWK